jgi:exopolyphosphatase/pppGpp-phosphohydrolase
MAQPPSDASTLEALQQCYAAARRHAGAMNCIVVLHMGVQQSGIAIGLGPVPEQVKLLPLGTERTARAHFHTTPPTPLAMENAIQWVEDVVMPLHTLVPQGAQLFCADTAVQEIALQSGVAPAIAQTLSLEAMERTFKRLIAMVEGSPAAHQGLPATNYFAAALLILREFMHHLQFAHIVVLNAP